MALQPPLSSWFIAGGLILAIAGASNAAPTLASSALVAGTPLVPSAPPPVVRVGTHTITPLEVSEAIKQCQSHTTTGQGSTETSNSAETTQTCLDRYFVPRWLLDQDAEDKKIAERPGFLHQKADLLYLSLLDRLAKETPPPSADEITNYIEAHARDFNKPMRIRIFRLLVNSEDEARKIIGSLKHPLDLTQFRALCRSESVDKATNERGGDLGFVWPDGSTDVPEVSADPQLYAAASQLKEGEWSQAPVPEDKRFAIVWRRGSLPQVSASSEDRDRAAALLTEQAVDSTVRQLIDELSQAQVKQRADVLLGRLRRKNTQLFVEP